MSRFLQACARLPVDATPVWLMRQAGRVLPAYRKIRASFDSFLDMTLRADVIAEVTMLPFAELDVDAAILFADIVSPLAALDVDFEIVKGGPVFASPIRSAAQVAALRRRPVAEAVAPLLEAIASLRSELSKPLIGFAGAPFTLASYMVEGGSSREFTATKSLMYREPDVWHALMDVLSDLLASYVREQVAAGVQAVQLFDSWAGTLSPWAYERFVLPYSSKVLAAASGVPRIHFGTGTATLLKLMAATPCDVVGVDWRIGLDDAWTLAGHDRAVQGNLEPAVLLGSRDVVSDRARDVLRRAGGRPGHVFNLGHGVLPSTPLDTLKALVDEVHAWRPE